VLERPYARPFPSILRSSRLPVYKTPRLIELGEARGEWRPRRAGNPEHSLIGLGYRLNSCVRTNYDVFIRAARARGRSVLSPAIAPTGETSRRRVSVRPRIT